MDLTCITVDGYNWHVLDLPISHKDYDNDYYEINQQLYYEQIIRK